MRIKMKNADIQGLYEFLQGEELSGTYSRLRSRFNKTLKTRLELIESERMGLIYEHCVRDEDGNPESTQVGDSTQFKIGDVEQFTKDYSELMDEFFVIEFTEENQEMLKCVKFVVLNTIKSFKDSEADAYDRWCDIVEGLIE